jgi:hypothetical protein
MQEAGQIVSMLPLPGSCRKAGEQFAEHRDADEQLRGMAHDRHDSRIGAFEGGVGVGIDGQNTDGGLFPERRIDLGKCRRVALKRPRLSTRPGTGKGIQVVKFLQCSRVFPRAASDCPESSVRSADGAQKRKLLLRAGAAGGGATRPRG